MFPRRSQGKHQDSRETKQTSFPRDLILSILLSQRGYPGLQVTGMIEWSQKSRPKKLPRASSKTQKIPGSKMSKINPQKSDAVAFKSSQAKEIKSSLKQKGISVMVKPTD